MPPDPPRRRACFACSECASYPQVATPSSTTTLVTSSGPPIVFCFATPLMCLLDGTVDCGHCTCMAGLGEVCSHVAAILFYLESAARSKLTCTQTSCMWKEPTFVDAIPYLPISELPLSKPKPRISCNKRRGAHHLSDITPLEYVSGSRRIASF